MASFNHKELVKKFILTFFILVSFISIRIAGVGDIYYCKMEEAIAIKGKNLIRIKLQKFNFKRTEYKIIMGSDDNYFRDLDFDIIWTGPSSNLEIIDGFEANSIGSKLYYADGNLYFSMTTFSNVTAISASCSKF